MLSWSVESVELVRRGRGTTTFNIVGDTSVGGWCLSGRLGSFVLVSPN